MKELIGKRENTIVADYHVLDPFFQKAPLPQQIAHGYRIVLLTGLISYT
jgi:hypothetical protein